MKFGKMHILIGLSICILLTIYYNSNNKKDSSLNVIQDLNEVEKNLKKESNNISNKYKIKPNIIFYVLNDEYLKNNDEENPNTSQLIREFICYDGVKNNISTYTNIIVLDKVDTIEEFRKKSSLNKLNQLKLPPNTIVSNEVLSKWNSESYDGLTSYSDESPKGLTYDNLY